METRRYENTPEYLENETFTRLTNMRKYIKVGLRHLMMHYKGEELLHKNQIKFIVKNVLQSALYFEKKAMETYDSLPDSTKEELETYYQEHLAFTPKPEYSSRQTPPDIIKGFNEKFEDNIKRAHEDAKEYLEKED